MTPSDVSPAGLPELPPSPWRRAATILVLLFIFLCGVSGLSSGIELLGHGVVDSFFASTANPFVALMVGILGTTLMQSSSVTTSMIVALVAAPENPLPIANAVPMVMGANIGTTVTNTVVALGHLGRKDEFRRAFAAATCHDFFNFISVAVLLPLELMTGLLTRTSGALASLLTGGGGGKLPNPLKEATKFVVHLVQSLLERLLGHTTAVGVGLLVLSVVGIFATLWLLVRALRSAAGGRVQSVITRSLDASPLIAMVAGAVMTVAVQSSSITTSVMVPLAGAGIVTVAQVFPITLGANVGTTMTALLATMAVPAATAHLAVQIALVHLLFNVLGILIVYPLPQTRRIPIRLAEGLTEMAVRSRRMAFVYIVGVFYGLPALLVALSKW